MAGFISRSKESPRNRSVLGNQGLSNGLSVQHHRLARAGTSHGVVGLTMCEPLTWCALRAAAEQHTRRDRIVWRARRPHPTTCVPVGPRTGLPDAARSPADRWFCRCACLSAIGPIGRFLLDAADGLIGMRHRRCLRIGVGFQTPLPGHVSAWRA